MFFIHKEYQGRHFQRFIAITIMKVEQGHIDHIRKRFADTKTKEDFVSLLSEAKQMLYGEDAKPVYFKSLTYYANPNLSKKRYSQFVVKKKSGGLRHINAPVKGLKSILKVLNFILQCVYEPHKAASGFVPGKSVVTNALQHKAMNYVYNIDLKDFFPSIELHRIKAVLKLPPFKLNNEKEPLAFMIANLCCEVQEVERLNTKGELLKMKKAVLPQGAPTSPTISNMIAQKLDRKLTGLAKRFGLNYSRYADDITFSSLHNVYQKDSEFLKELNRIIIEQGFEINPKKTRLQKSGYQQEVTGLIVNEKVNVRRRYVKQIRMWLYYWKKYGYAKAEQIFLKDYLKDKGYTKKGNPSMINVLSGKLEYLKMVKGSDDTTFIKLNGRFRKLIFNLEAKQNIGHILEEIFGVWEKYGIEKAIKLYNKYKILN